MPARPLFRARVIATAIAVVVGLFLAYASTVRYPARPVAFEPDPGVWPGVFHVHTVASDGNGTVEDVVRAAKASGAAWVVVADHNTMDARRFRLIDGVLVVFAPEVGVPNGHVTAIGVARALTRPERRAKDALKTIERLGGASVAAHPLGRKRPYRQLDEPGLAGLEVLSADAEFRDALVRPDRFVPSVLAYLVNPMHGVARLVRRPAPTFTRWDQLLATRRMAGFCAVDAHGLPSYDVMMRLLQMYAVVGRPRTGDAEADAAALVETLLGGRSFCGVDAFGAAGGFRFSAAAGPQSLEMGQDVPQAARPVLRVDLAYSSLPDGVQPSMVCGGETVKLAESPVPVGRRFEYRPDRPGACRVEILLGPNAEDAVPWIVSNPIYVR